jgi:hypothetical protein
MKDVRPGVDYVCLFPVDGEWRWHRIDGDTKTVEVESTKGFPDETAARWDAESNNRDADGDLLDILERLGPDHPETS